MERKLFDAIGANDLAAAEQLIATQKSAVNARREDGVSALMFTVYANRPEIRALLLANGADVSFHESAAIGRLETMHKWLDTDPKRINDFSDDGWTALHLACFFGHLKPATLLISLGADLNLFSRNATRVMPLHSALATKQWTIARHLIEAGADLHAPAGELNLTPLHYAAANGAMEICELLITLEADASARSADGKTAAQFAFENGHLGVAEFLRGAG